MRRILILQYNLLGQNIQLVSLNLAQEKSVRRVEDAELKVPTDRDGHEAAPLRRELSSRAAQSGTVSRLVRVGRYFHWILFGTFIFPFDSVEFLCPLGCFSNRRDVAYRTGTFERTIYMFALLVQLRHGFLDRVLQKRV